jgi:hypothetical protein
MTAEPSVDVRERPMSYPEACRILWEIIDSKPELWSEKIPPIFESRPWALGGFEVPWRLHEDAVDRVVANCAGLLVYADKVGRMTHTGVRKLDNIDELVAKWVESFVVMATAHSDEARVKMDQTSDELLMPLLHAPIAQVREFVRRVARALEEDPRVPWIVWSSFKKIVEPVVVKGKDGEEVALHELLAVEIAELVVPKLETADLVSAVARALQWRDPTKLEEIKAAVGRKDAPKPRLRGGQSCLFLAVEDADGKELAEVVL